MAGMLPGVEMQRRSRRRKAYSHRLHHHDQDTPPDFFGNQSYHTSLVEPSMVASTNMDRTALIARRRLGEKLGYFPSSRPNRGRDTRTMMSTNDSDDHLVTRILGRPWHFQINKKSTSQLCVVCLEDFRAEQQLMELPCSHKYHSKCLVPWLAAHPNCPSCRSPVQP